MGPWEDVEICGANSTFESQISGEICGAISSIELLIWGDSCGAISTFEFRIWGEICGAISTFWDANLSRRLPFFVSGCFEASTTVIFCCGDRRLLVVFCWWLWRQLSCKGVGIRCSCGLCLTTRSANSKAFGQVVFRSWPNRATWKCFVSATIHVGEESKVRSHNGQNSMLCDLSSDLHVF